MSGLEKEKYNSKVQLTEDSQFNENIVNVPNFGTQKEEWNLSGTIEQCIIRCIKIRWRSDEAVSKRNIK